MERDAVCKCRLMPTGYKLATQQNTAGLQADSVPHCNTRKQLSRQGACPCAGLDSFAALSVMGHLQNVAQVTQQTVIATIHQPRSAIWEMFDTVSADPQAH